MFTGIVYYDRDDAIALECLYNFHCDFCNSRKVPLQGLYHIFGQTVCHDRHMEVVKELMEKKATILAIVHYEVVQVPREYTIAVYQGNIQYLEDVL